MFRLIKNIIKITLLFIAVALILNLRYQGRSARDYAEEYGLKLFQWAYQKSKSLNNKDIEQLIPAATTEIKKEVESLMNKGDNSKSIKAESQKADQLTSQDRARLKQLVEEKMKPESKKEK